MNILFKTPVYTVHPFNIKNILAVIIKMVINHGGPIKLPQRFFHYLKR